eukprot:m.872064 g.872064  ORF g.872064 m.872064 type:complete len:890 (+) comp59774_c0_seq5:141-2810(+)
MRGRMVLALSVGVGLVHVLLLNGLLRAFFGPPHPVHWPPADDAAPSDISDRLQQAPASRLVFIISDGMRYDKLAAQLNAHLDEAGVERPYNRTEMFFRQRLFKNARFGRGLARLPSETRRGHVALLAGVFEGIARVSSLLRETSTDLLEYDTVFNQSTSTWAWGSVDIVPLFRESLQYHPHAFGSDEQDLSRNDMTNLDEWVFSALADFLPTLPLDHKARQSGTVFFLHLNGVDMSGHARGSDSAFYQKSINYVDQGVERVFNLFESAFPDARTAYFFSSDHGQTDHGAHGSSSVSETETPIVMWGAGFHQASPAFHPNVRITPQFEAEQVHLAPLLASVVGLPIPRHSRGVIPKEVAFQSEEQTATAVFANAQQLLEQYIVLLNDVQEHSVFQQHSAETEGERLLSAAQTAFERRDFTNATSLARQSAQQTRDDLRELEVFHRFNNVAFAILGHVLLIVILACRALRGVGHTAAGTAVLMTRLIKLVVVATVIGTTILHVTLDFDTLLVAGTVGVLSVVFLAVFDASLFPKLLQSESMILAVLLGTLNFLTFFDRRLLSVSLMLVSNRIGLRHQFDFVLYAIATLLPVVPVQFDIRTILVGYPAGFLSLHVILTVLMVGSLLKFIRKSPMNLRLHLRMISAVSLFCLLLAYANFLHIQFQMRIPEHMQMLAWAVLVVLLVALVVSPHAGRDGLLLVMTACYPIYLLLSVSIECSLYLLLCRLCWVWVLSSNERAAQAKTLSNQLGTASVFVTLFFFAFFGFGQEASISSYKIVSTMSFVSVYNLDVMALLLAIKASIPLFVVCTSLVVVVDGSGRAGAGLAAAVWAGVLLLLPLPILPAALPSTENWQVLGEFLSKALVMCAFVGGFLVLTSVARLTIRRPPAPAKNA